MSPNTTPNAPSVSAAVDTVVWCPAESDGRDGRASEPSDTAMMTCLSCGNRSRVSIAIEPRHHPVQGLKPRFVRVRHLSISLLAHDDLWPLSSLPIDP